MKLHTLAFSLMAILCIACSSRKQESKENDGVETALPSQPNEVTTMILKKKVFDHELVSNGKISATKYADLTFRTSEVIDEVLVKNGDRVHKGQKIAVLDMFKLKNSYEQRKTALAQTELEMKDVLIGQGYSPDNIKSVPTDVLELAMIKSGYKQNKAQYEAAEYDIKNAVLTAPFDGVVANLFEKPHNMASTSEPLCRIIAGGPMEVDMTVLESELPLVKLGDKVEVTPYASTVGICAGRVSEINPLVDTNGMVRVKVSVDGGGKLFDGMNVRVSVKRSIGEQLVVPKSAVVLRSGKQVVFALDKGKAQWVYVHTGLENMNEYVVNDGLEEGMEVIVTGNVNLAHEAPVNVINGK